MFSAISDEKQRNELEGFYKENLNCFLNTAYLNLHNKNDAQDAVQEAFREIIRDLENFEQTLEKYSGWFWVWNNVDCAVWSKTVNSNSIRLVNTKSGLTSGKYRMKSVFTLTNKQGKTEKITVYSDERSV